MAPNKSLVLLAAILLVAAVGQVRSALPAGLLSSPPSTAINNPIGVITGVVPCSIGNNINVTAVPPFANAMVLVVCGNTTVASATTNGSGTFVINLGPLLNMTTAVVTCLLTNQARVVVTTPLAACNVSLTGANGTLGAPLQVLNGTQGAVASVFGITVTTTDFFVTIIALAFNFVTGLIS
ncbi:unnamed protein product [Urochloa decumbens]|uniref:Uncharacterized protein n=1 Tax=Urochloa decumbens TaxID=240449 RepID=A0ABC8XR12_9POAL